MKVIITSVMCGDFFQLYKSNEKIGESFKSEIYANAAKVENNSSYCSVLWPKWKKWNHILH